MSWVRALEQIAYVAGELHVVRQTGFTEAALAYPRSEAGMIALCAFNGIKPEQAPRGWRYWPNPAMKKSWERVIDALQRAASGDIEKLVREAYDEGCNDGADVEQGVAGYPGWEGTRAFSKLAGRI